MDFVRRFVDQFRTIRQAASRRSRRRLLRISPEQLECRALLAAVTDSGNTLRIELEAGEQLDIQSNGSSYTFGSSNAVFTDGGVFDAGDFTGFGSDSLTLLDLPQYFRLEIVDAGADASVRFSDAGSGVYRHHWDVLLDNSANAESVLLDGQVSIGNYDLTVTTDGGIRATSRSELLTVNGNVNLTADNTTDGTLVKRGIWLVGTTITTSGRGDIYLHGEGARAPHLANLDGVAVTDGTVIRSTAVDPYAGHIEIVGASGGGQDFETGVWIQNSTISSVEGRIRIDGRGGDGDGSNHFGVRTDNALIQSTGQGFFAAPIHIEGQGGAGSAFGVGIGLFGQTRLMSAGGDVQIIGQGGTGAEHSNSGVRFNEVQIESTGDGDYPGNIRIEGTGGGGTAHTSGVIMRGPESAVSTVGGAVEVVGLAGDTDDGEGNYGALVEIPIRTVSGSISVSGQGGMGQRFNYGVLVSGTGAVLETQTGSITLVGVGGASTEGDGLGTQLASGAVVQSERGNIRISGEGGDGGAGNIGVELMGGSRVESTGTERDAGTITVNGTGHGLGEWNHGLRVWDSSIRSGYGDVSLTGMSQNGRGNGRGITLVGDFRIESTGVGPDAAKLTLNGRGGSSLEGNIGVVSFADPSVTEGIFSHDGDISIGGVSNGTTQNNHGASINADVRVTGLGSIQISGYGGRGDWGRGLELGESVVISTQAGDVRLSGSGAIRGENNEGVFVGENASVLSSSGDIEIFGMSSSANSYGVELFGDTTGGATLLSDTGDLTITARADSGGPKDALRLHRSVQIGDVDSTGDVLLAADTIDLSEDSSMTSRGDLTIRPRLQAPTRQVTVGMQDSGSPTDLNLTAEELTAISPLFRRVTIGDNLNNVVVSVGEVPIEAPLYIEARRILLLDVLATTSREMILNGVVNPGRAVAPLESDAILESGTLELTFSGDTPGQGPDGFEQFVTVGSFSIAPRVELLPVWEPAWRPKGGESLTIVQRTGGVGTFAGLPEGATLPGFFDATISYVGGDGDDIVLTLPASVDVPRYAQLNQFASTGITLFGEDPDGGAGRSVNSAGDVNGDGQPDFLVSANFAQGPGDAPENSGLVYLIYGRPDLPSQIDLADIDQYGVLFVGAALYDTTGHFVDASDFNQDGYDDVLIGAFRREGLNNEHDAGGGYVIWGGASLPSVIDLAALGSLGVTIYGPDPDDLVGNPVAHVGDLNDDGYPDFGLGAIWADGEDNTGERVGEAYIVYGGATLPEQIDLATVTSGVTRIYGHQSDDEAGVSVARLGDVNGDDIDDLLIGARYADGVGDAAFRAGESYIIYGSATIPEVIRLGSDADVTIYGTDAYDFSGWRADPGGDVNADGYNDILIGAVGADSVNNARIDAGEVYLIFGGPALPMEIRTNNLGNLGVTFYGADPNDNAGRSVDIVGDLNADGYDDIAIAAPESSGLNNAQGRAGEVSIFLGRASWPTSFDLNVAGTADFTLYGIDAGDRAGINVQGAGDLNQDGIDDLIIGAEHAHSWNNSRTDAGEAYVISGQSLFVPARPVVHSPSGTSRETRPTIEWYASTEAESYELWLEHLGGDANPVINPTVTGTSYTLLQDLEIGRYRAWVRANKEGGSKSAWTSVTFTVTVPATIVPLTFTGDLTPTIDWSDVPGAVDYRVYVQNITTLETVLDERVSASQLDITTDLTFGRHRIWVQATGINGFTAEWSDSVDYQVQPQQLGPFEPTLNVRPTFSWTQMEGVESVQLWVQRGSTVVINETGLTGTSYTPSEDLEFGLYRWWIRPVAANGRSAGWSPLGEFNVGGQTTITAPADPVDNGLAVIEWLPVDGAVSYEVYLATTSGQLIRHVEGLTGTTFDSPPLQDDSYVVWVRSHADGTPGMWSRPLEFDVVSTAGLTAQPVDLQRTTFALRPTLQWTGSSAATYNVYITGGATTILQQSIEGTQWTVTTDLPEGLWTWYVQAANEGGQTGEWSDPATIDTSGRAIVLAPTGAQSALRPTFTWGVVEGAVEYILYVENRDTGMQVLNETGLTGTEFTPDFGFDRASFRVWVRAVSLSKAGPWSLFVDFQLV